MKNPENILQVMKYSPDYLGFIFYKPSPRYAGGHLDQISRMAIPASIGKVGVFVDEDMDAILQIYSELALDLVQLHGHEPVQLCERLKDRGIPVMKVFSVGTGMDYEKMAPYAEVVDYFLFDTLGKYHGGNNLAFDWDLLKDYPFAKPFFLGGGIGPDNIEGIEKLKNPYLHAVDANSRLESSPGTKDPDKVKLLIKKFNKLKI